MEWYNYIAAFFAGAFLANAVPHFVYGVCGDKFPTPFAKPPGKGLSSPIVNVIWAGVNIIIGYVLFFAGKVDLVNCLSAGIFFAGFILMAISSANTFQQKHKE